jgi:hypothetical protein
MIKKVESGSQLAAEFEGYDRGESFTREAFDALADYYNEIAPDMELDVVAIDGDWSEYTLTELVDQYTTYQNIEHKGQSYIIDFDNECFVSIEDVIGDLGESHSMVTVVADSRYLISG